MKFLKMFTLGALAAAALSCTVGVGGASATVLTCNGSTCEVGQTLHLVSEGKIVWDAPFGNVQCESTLHQSVTEPGSSTTTSRMNVSIIAWVNCTGDSAITLISGTIEIHRNPLINIPEVTSTGARITFIHLGVHCIFETNNTKIGTLTGSSTTGATATMHVSGTVPRVGGSGGVFCGSSAPITGSYRVDTPDSLDVD